MTELHRLTLAELNEGLRARRFSSVELTRHFLARIERFNPALNAFITVTGEQALAAAQKADQRSRPARRCALTGLPIVHKDIFCTDGVLTTCGSRMLSNFVAPYDATVVERLSQAGVVMLGKTNMDEFAMGSSNETSWYGPVRNPWDPKKVPGGSSGGSAAAVAARLAPAATGTDTGGSIRQPAALTGADRLQADLRPRVALRNDRVRLEPRSGRHADADGQGRGDAARAHGGLRSARLDQRRHAGARLSSARSSSRSPA